MNGSTMYEATRRAAAAATVGALVLLIAITTTAGPRRVLDRVAALVGEEIVTEHEVDVAVRPYLSQIYRIEDPVERMKALDKRRFEVLDQLINEVLMLEEARRLELPVSDEEVEAHIQKTMRANGWTLAELEANLKQLGYDSVAAYREKTRKDMLKSYAFQVRVGARVNVTQAEVQRTYEERYGGGEQEEVRASHILIRMPATFSQDTLDAARAKAEKVQKLAASGVRPFAELAAEYSEDGATAAGGGDLGYFTRYLLDETITRHAFALRPGEVSGVIETPLGFHVLKVTDRRSVPIDDFAREEILSLISQELTIAARERAFRQWMRELRESAYIEIRLPSVLEQKAEAEKPSPAPESP